VLALINSKGAVKYYQFYLIIDKEKKMAELQKMRGVACRGGEPMLTDEEIAAMQPEVPEWQVIEVEGVKRLERAFKLKNFIEAMAFTNKIGMIAEKEDHHPLIVTEWGRVKVQWWTHKIKGLHQYHCQLWTGRRLKNRVDSA
jgi:4a-hydroxytetrahydrobiopterin dehydratase